MPCPRLFHQPREDGFGGGIVGIGALWMPLHSKHEVTGTRIFHRLNHSVFAGTRGDAQTVAGNAQRLDAPVSFVACDLLSAFADGSMDLIVSNPPYVPLGDQAGLQREVRDWEPPEALFAGPTGVEIYARLVRDAERVLRPGGWIVMELGFNLRDRVAAMFILKRPQTKTGWCMPEPVPEPGREKLFDSVLIEHDYDSLPCLQDPAAGDPASADPEPPPPSESTAGPTDFTKSYTFTKNSDVNSPAHRQT